VTLPKLLEEVDRYQLNRFNNFAARGSVTFGATPAGFGGPDLPALTGFQNWLLGRVTTTQGGAGLFNNGFRAFDAAAYVQDDWKLASRLTLNVGLRWEGLSTAHDINDYLSNWAGSGDGLPGPISIVHPEGTPKVGTPGVSDCTLGLGMTTFQSGTPFIVIDSSALTLQDAAGVNGTNFATLAPGATLSSVQGSGSVESRLDGYINMNAFTAGGNCVNDQNVVVDRASPDCTGYAAVGNVGRNSFRGPFQQNWDLSIIKRTTISEGKSIDFRAEFFNIFNHPVFQSPQAAGITGFNTALGNYGVVDVASSDTSILATVNRPRIIQFALKFNF